tara:strand:+ start:1349 stop:1681 length:333 start_codon:yes stop_codon:yes gene_type:complete
MTNQLFKSNPPNSLLFDLLDKIYLFKNDNHFVINDTSFKKSIYLDLLSPFCEELKEYYHASKTFYVDRELNYSKFITIIRQICKKNGIAISSKIKYDKSKYCINYFIYKN